MVDRREAAYEAEREDLATAIVTVVNGQYIGRPPPLLTGWSERAVSAVLSAGWLPPAAVQELLARPRPVGMSDTVLRVDADIPTETIRRAFGLDLDLPLSEQMLQELREQYERALADGSLNRLDTSPRREVTRSQLNAVLDDLSQPQDSGDPRDAVVRDDVERLLRVLGIAVVD